MSDAVLEADVTEAHTERQPPGSIPARRFCRMERQERADAGRHAQDASRKRSEKSVRNDNKMATARSGRTSFHKEASYLILYSSGGIGDYAINPP
ncbi:MAG: hypothetical protein AAGM38_11595 [Pseudomonadota bacterium]